MSVVEKSFYAGPCGVEPYDKEWGVGVSGMVDNPSPYPRINRMLKWLDAVTPGADHERACLVTEAYQKHSYKPQIVKVCGGSFQRTEECNRTNLSGRTDCW